MGRRPPFAILYSESVTLFGRVVRVYGREVITGICVDGATRADVDNAMNAMIGEYLHENESDTE